MNLSNISIVGGNLNILITGGEGFIGSSTAKILASKGHNITSIDKRRKNNYFSKSDEIEYKKIDITNYDALKETIVSIDGIIHLAAVSRVIWGEIFPQVCIDTNIKGTLNIVQAAKRSNKMPWIIFGSSREVYGETNGESICENYPENPINTYGITKYAAEQLVKQYSKQNGMKAVSLRFSNVYGDLTDILDRVTPKFILNALLGDTLEIQGGKQIMDFTHITDTTDGIIKTVEKLQSSEEESYYDCFNLLPGEANSLYDLIEYIKPRIDNEVKVSVTEGRNYDVDRFVGNPSKAEEILGFKCKIKFKEGVKKTMHLYKEELEKNEEIFVNKFMEDQKCILP